MTTWHCSARNCPTHSEPGHRCPIGVWFCGRRQPPCPGHSSPDHRCATGNVWHCGARNCPNHSRPEHRCQSGVWFCGRRQPPCPGHSRLDHRCLSNPRPTIPIQIPADLTIVTLRTRSQNLPQRWTETLARSVLQSASSLLRARAGIEFRLGTCERVVEEMPPGARADRVDEPGYHFLVAAHRAGNGCRALLVDKVSRPELGGQARHQTRVCLIVYGSDLGAASRVLAHELGHLLELPHVDEGRRAGPGQELQIATWMRNLMFSGALNPAAELTPDQVQLAHSSALARRFGGR